MQNTYKKKGRNTMRYAYAKWLIEVAEQDGVGFGGGELAEVEEAEFRVYGPARLARSETIDVQSDLTTDDVPTWEAEVLGCVLHELMTAFASRGENE
jgi:hypothetical protein